MQAHARFLHCVKDSLAFIEIPKEMTERLLERGLMEKEKNYYQALQAKEDLVGFHPFKKMALNREIKKMKKEYNEGLALLENTPENKLKHPPRTTLEEWKKNLIPVEKIQDEFDIPEEVIEEKIEPKQTQLDLGEMIHARKDAPVVAVEKEEQIQKNTPELGKAL